MFDGRDLFGFKEDFYTKVAANRRYGPSRGCIVQGYVVCLGLLRRDPLHYLFKAIYIISNEGTELMIHLCSCRGGSSLTPERRRKRAAVASCKVCGGKPLADGSGLLSGSMLSTVGLEHRNIINPNLTWKTVTKGNRTSSRRPRKCTANILNHGDDLIDKNQKMDDNMSVSESEKLGVNVLGRRFSDKLEQVPIKKRRFLFRSPSPPMPFADMEEPALRVKSLTASVCMESSPNSNAKRRVKKIDSTVSYGLNLGGTARIVKSEEIHGKLDYSEDFSGISILAAAACSDGIEVGTSSTESCFVAKESFKEPSPTLLEISKDGANSSSISEVRVEGVPLETSDSSAIHVATSFSKAIIDGKNTGVPFPNSTVAMLPISPSKKVDTLKRRVSSSLDDRLHWDLNIVMDAWDDPCEDYISTSERGDAYVTSEDCEKPPVFKDSEALMDRKDTQGGSERTLEDVVAVVVSAGISEEIGRFASPGVSTPVNLDRVEHKSNPLLATNYSLDNMREHKSKPFHNQETSSPSVDSDSPVPENCPNRVSPDSMCKQTGAGLALLHKSGDFTCSSNPRHGDYREAISEMASGVLNDAKNKSEILVASKVSLNCEEQSTSGTSVEGEHTFNAATNEQDSKVSIADGENVNANEQNSSTLVESPRVVDASLSVDRWSTQEACNSNDDPVNSSSKIAFDDSFDDNEYDTDVSESGPAHVSVSEKTIEELQTGYESQYEDGELREEPNGHYMWEDDAGDEGDTEHVDYGSEDGLDCKKEKSLEVDHVDFEGEVVNERKIHEAYSQPYQRGSSNMELRLGKRRQLNSVNEQSVGHLGRINGINVEMLSAKESCQLERSRVKFTGWSQGPRRCESSMEMVTGYEDGIDLTSRKDRGYLKWSRSNNVDYTNHRFQRNNIAWQRRVGDRWLDSSGRQQFVSNRRHSPNYYGPKAGFVHPGSKNAVTSAAAKVGNSGFVFAQNGSLGPVDRVPRQSLNGRGSSPVDRDEAFGMHVRVETVRNMISDKCNDIGRARSGRYDSQMVIKGPRERERERERYNGPAPDGTIGRPLREQHSLDNRERSLSSVQRRGAPHPSRLRMRSRSRSRSPQTWLSPKGRYSSRSSPSFRLPHRRPDHMPGFTPIPGNRSSPPHNYWSDDRKDDLNNVRERGSRRRFSLSERISPGRPFRQNHRLELIESPVRLRPDEYYRPICPVRFNEMSRAGKAPRGDSSDEGNRKRGGRYGRVQHPMRRYDPDDTVKRFLYDVENDFSLHGSSRDKETSGFNGRDSPRNFARVIDSRVRDEGPRRDRGEKGHVRYNREGKYSANSSLE
ncbi:hypothetical protein GIB67_000386 [Kingdonia uniflora]|uniref:Uncharacterized protein n=1 Tax=Kingdonia uniflora TaxID=39325 RepID=A0A7J7P0Q5_9MAGN|nr:hypothetical protein GIB67_000386 [Kingdonia uniflora]